jgi:ABC-type nitrate/sulfonate/bicarbonate transport system ATPase subunit
MNHAIALQQVSQSYARGDGSVVEALQNVDLEIQGSEFVSLLGPSGCGKSTLLRLIAGLEPAQSGRLVLGDEPITGPDQRRGLVFQDPNLFPWLTVWDNIAFGPRLKSARPDRSRVAALIRLVGLEGFEKSYPHQLSGGMAQRAALARTLINEPEVLLLDEPLGALDSFTRMSMQEELLRVWESAGTTMIMVTHDIDEAIFLSDRIAVFSARPGRIQTVIPVPLSRPRLRNSPEFIQIRSRILELFHFAHSLGDPEEPFL